MSGAPRRLDLRADPDLDLTPAIRHLRADGPIAYPTETVYGLGGVTSERAVARVRELKGRHEDKPLIALVESAEAVSDLRWTESARELADVFWPGALTLVLDDPLGIFPVGVRDEVTGRVAVRVSPNRTVARLLAGLHGPVTSTSLNAPGGAPATSGSEALDVVRGLGGGDVLVLDVGTLPPSGPSTIVDCTGEEPIVLREGAIPIGRLRCAIPETHGNESD